MVAPRKRLLLVGYHFPPVASVGSVRVGALAKYLPRCGWEVTVVTPRRPGPRPAAARVVETRDVDRAAACKRLLGLRPELGLKDQVGAAAGTRAALVGVRARVVESLKAIAFFPDAHRGWARVAAAAGRRLAAEQRFDALLTSSPPVSVHLAGRRLRETLDAPWVADLRDLWADDHNSTAPAWRRRLDLALERRTLRHADVLVTVSEPLAARLRALHGPRAARAILNGFDPELVGLAERVAPEFTICHTGTFYQGRRDPTPLLEVLSDLFARGRMDRRRVRVRLLSRQEPWLRAAIDAHGLADVVAVEAWAPWEVALRTQQESQILLLLHWGGPGEEGVYTGKVFEYLAARRPILMLGGAEGVLAELLRETGAGVHVRDRAGLERQLVDWWEEYERCGSVTWRGDDRRLARYSHLRMAEEFASLLDGLVAPGGACRARGRRRN